MNYWDFKPTVIGKLIDDGKGGYKGECLSLNKIFFKAVTGVDAPPSGSNSALGYWNNFPAPLGNYFDKVPNSSTAVPSNGDFIIFQIGAYGHIGIVESANTKTVDVLNQNWPKGNLTDKVQITTFNYITPKVVGWLHWKNINNQGEDMSVIEELQKACKTKDDAIIERDKTIAALQIACTTKDTRIIELSKLPTEVIKEVEKIVEIPKEVKVEIIKEVEKQLSEQDKEKIAIEVAESKLKIFIKFIKRLFRRS